MRKNNLSKRAAAARAKSAGALHAFRAAAKQLEDAAKEHNHVANVAAAVASEHERIREDHVQQSVQAANAATKLRELVGGGE